MNREVILYTTRDGKCPVNNFLDGLELKVVKKIIWTLHIVEETAFVPKTYFKKLESSDGIWEVRIKLASNIYRILCFWDHNNIIVLTHGITKKSQKTPSREIKLAEGYRKDYFRRKKNET